MKYYSKSNKKEIALVALLVAIVGMSIGFAAFSTTLNISSSASVSPSSNSFKIVLCDNNVLNYCDDYLSEYVLSGKEFNGARDIDGFVSEKYAGFKVAFTSNNQSVTYGFYAQNVGEYDAYLSSIYFEPLSDGSYKRCSASTTDETKATDSLVQSACNGIKEKIIIDGSTYNIGDNISGHKLTKGESEYIQVVIEYEDGAQLADGPFNVEFGNLRVDYSTVDNPVSLISFTISGIEYQAEEGMTWNEWLDSSFNTGEWYAYSNMVISDGVRVGEYSYITYVSPSDEIINATSYNCLMGFM